MFQKLDHLQPAVKTLACSWVSLIDSVLLIGPVR